MGGNWSVPLTERAVEEDCCGGGDMLSFCGMFDGGGIGECVMGEIPDRCGTAEFRRLSNERLGTATDR